MFARKNDDGHYDLFEDTGESLTRAPEAWAIVWPLDSDVSAFHYHPEGITLSAAEYNKIRHLAPMEEESALTPEEVRND